MGEKAPQRWGGDNRGLENHNIAVLLLSGALVSLIHFHICYPSLSSQHLGEIDGAALLILLVTRSWLESVVTVEVKTMVLRITLTRVQIPSLQFLGYGVWTLGLQFPCERVEVRIK